MLPTDAQARKDIPIYSGVICSARSSLMYKGRGRYLMPTCSYDTGDAPGPRDGRAGHGDDLRRRLG